jgi:hypothetical protein
MIPGDLGGGYEGRGGACAVRGRLIVSGGLAGSCPTGPGTNSLPLYTATRKEVVEESLQQEKIGYF